MSHQNKIEINILAKELEEEVHRILQYWEFETLDLQNGGFLGEIDFDNRPVLNAKKGLVLNSRILWSFAAGAQMYPQPGWKLNADRAFHYISKKFIDPLYGGAYWSVDAAGIKLDGKKQTYGVAFCIYGLSEYVKLTGSEEALNMAIQLYHELEHHALDTVENGYVEALAEDWKPLSDVRLSDKDLNTPKTTNTHLHVIEAYANLYTVWPNPALAAAIKNLLVVFKKKIIDLTTGHLKLFFTNNWRAKAGSYSLGHDIETAWLLQHCAAVLNDDAILNEYKEIALTISKAIAKWVDDDGGLNYEMDAESGVINKEKHCWVQAEAMVGFYNAWQLTNDEMYLKLVFKIWAFIKLNLLDMQKGEWHWGVDDKGKLLKEPKAGFWKCPYHNTRACLELIKRIQQAST